ncbi:Autophagy-related protein 5 [Macleaya cordata]|uniref:Autophagy protein 5 n=1 Tax=Macleaya cordata TaxID=56857 RepID=A0A200QV09_MACCD|nr:Autophagy-related protein 5 [Macleaya cordata]
MVGLGTEAQKYVWEGAIPLQIHLHESEITTLPSPPPALILGPRMGYLPLLVPQIKPYFSDTLPPGVDTVWFDYKGIPLKWYIPIGVLFDLLCVEPERPWNLTVHFRGYPADLLSPCEGEDSVKWSFINSLKEAAYIINGNSKNVMNMSQVDQLELWRSILNREMEVFLRISSKLKLGTVGEDYTKKVTSPRQTNSETDTAGSSRTGRIPVRLYVRNVGEDIDDLEDVPPIDSWDRICYINKPVEIHKEEGKIFTLHDAVKVLLPEFFPDEEPSIDEEISRIELEDEPEAPESNLCNQDLNISTAKKAEVGASADEHQLESSHVSGKSEIRLVRIQGIEPKLDIPFSWVVTNLMNPEHFLHICVCVGVSQDPSKTR